MRKKRTQILALLLAAVLGGQPLPAMATEIATAAESGAAGTIGGSESIALEETQKADEQSEADEQPQPTKEPEADEQPQPTKEPEADEQPQPTKEPEADEQPQPTGEPEADEQPQPTGEPEADRDYIYGRPMTEEEIARQKAHEPKLTMRQQSEPEPERAVSYMRARAYLPERYDLRDYGYVTSVKSQEPFDTCWAFSANAAIESSLILNQLEIDGVVQTAQTTDVSEFHTAYFFYNRTGDPLNLTSGDRNHTEPGWDYRSNGGNLMMAALAYAGWTGTESEADAPYAWAELEDGQEPVQPQQEFSADAKLRNAFFINGDVDQVKEAIRSYGALAMMYRHESRYYNYDTGAYRYPLGGSSATNHAATIVGWDDTYAKENFRTASGVTQDGAWIVKNSWSADWGDEGYFYLSYEDSTLCNITAFEFQEGESYEYNYHYDGSSLTTACKTGGGTELANVFEVQGQTADYEVLEAVSFALQSANVPYKIQIYRDLPDSSNPVGGTPVFERPLTGTTRYAGIYTVDLPEAVLMAKGTVFSVVISLPQNTEYYAERTASANWISATAVTEAGQSFWKNSYGVWQDLHNDEICARIKAFTSSADPIPALTKVSAFYDRTELAWGENKGIEGYEIYRAEREDGAYRLIAETDAKLRSYVDTEVRLNETYYYKLRSFWTEGAERVYSAYSSIQSVSPKLVTPTISGKSGGYNKAVLSWGKIDGATGYRIYRSTSKSSGFSAIRNLKSGDVLSYTNGSLETDKAYYYKMRAFRVVKEGGQEVYYYSAYCDPVEVKPKLATPTISGKSGGYNKAVLSWGKIDGATGYRIYRSTSKSSGFSAIRNLKSGDVLSYTNGSLATGKAYYYKMRAFRVSGNKTYYSAYTEPVKVTPTLATPSLKGKAVGNRKVSLSWKKIDGATGYRIYRSTSKSSGFSAIRNLKNGNILSYTNGPLTKGKTYYYKMRAFRVSGGKTYYSAYTSPVGVKVK